jgi:hypothetical protein
MKTLQQCIDELINNKTLKTLVDNYENENRTFYSNKKRTEFFNAIDDLYKQIVYNNKVMNRKVKCMQCPPSGIIELLMKFIPSH